jgi:2-polyprenyl-6-methoxyphenol hydroxylase-like FAD-dependent oxidoreductase
MGKISDPKNLRKTLTMTRIPDLEIHFPWDCIEILRSRPFTFSARSCNKWAVGRVILVGDAAHVFPPCESPPTVLLSEISNGM